LQQPAENHVFLAAGTGIAPIRSMVHWLMNEPDHHRKFAGLAALWRKGSGISVLSRGVFTISATASNVHYTPILSRPQKEWNGASGYVQHHLHSILPDRRMHIFAGLQR